MNQKLTSTGKLTSLVKLLGIHSWNELLTFVQQLPYGRNSNRHDLSLVIKEQKGSCSSKHAFLKAIADENHINNIQLILGMYKMSSENTNIGNTISNANLNYIPEAHCYLKIDGVRTDVTSQNASFDKIKTVLLQELEIEPDQVAEFKVNYHKEFIQNWMLDEKINKSFQDVWEVRERCISYLSNNN